MLNDPLANAMSSLMNAEHHHKGSCKISPTSKTVKKVLEIMNEQKYIGEVQSQDTPQGSVNVVSLIGAINKCGAVKPRYAVKNQEFERFEKKFLPARNFGIMIVSTPQGVMTHIEAKQKALGGRLLAYCY